MSVRAYPRVTCSIAVKCRVGSRNLRLHALNLSGGGVFIHFDTPRQFTEEVSIDFRPAPHQRLIRTTLAPRHFLAGRGIGFEYTKITPADRERILRLVLFRRGKIRKEPRASLVTQVEHAAGSFLGFSRDVSPAGMFVETREIHPVGTQFLVRFRLGDSNDEPIIAARAEVTYEIERLGLGIRFTRLTKREQERIESYASGHPLPSSWHIKFEDEPGIFGVS